MVKLRTPRPAKGSNWLFIIPFLRFYKLLSGIVNKNWKNQKGPDKL